MPDLTDRCTLTRKSAVAFVWIKDEFFTLTKADAVSGIHSADRVSAEMRQPHGGRVSELYFGRIRNTSNLSPSLAAVCGLQSLPCRLPSANFLAFSRSNLVK
jgi:hypothetical protein